MSLPNYAFFGKGFVYVDAGTGDAVVKIKPQGSLNAQTSYVLKAWIVDRTTYDKDPSIAYTAELDLVIVSASYRAGTAVTLPPGFKSSSVSLAFSFVVFLLAILFSF